MKNKGFTLIELIIVITIITIISAIAIPTYRRWMKKVSIENDTKMIFALLSEARARAFAEKRACGIIFDGATIRLRCDTDADDDINDETTDINSATIKNAFIQNLSSGVLYTKFDKDGTASITGNIHAEDISTDPTYSCINISRTRIKMGKWDGSTCQVK